MPGGSLPRRSGVVVARHARRALVGVLACASAIACQAVTAGGAGALEAVGERPAAATSGFPVSVSTPYGKVTLQRRPQRVISLSPTVTEMLFAIGAGPQVVAVDNDSDYPPGAPRTKLSGYTPNVEPIAGYRPDLVVISYNPTPPNLVASLKVLGIPTLYIPAADNLAQTYAELTELGEVTGRVTGAQREVVSMRLQVSSLVAEVPHLEPSPSYFYEVGYGPLYTATARTFIGSVLAMAGLRNIAGASVAGSDYPEYSNEAVLHADPTFVFLADGVPLSSVAARPGWSVLGAVRDGRVVELNPDVASRWGPRIVDLFRTVVNAVRRYAKSTAGH
jgi:iron complex transport system substrate-binding protein